MAKQQQRTRKEKYGDAKPKGRSKYAIKQRSSFESTHIRHIVPVAACPACPVVRG